MIPMSTASGEKVIVIGLDGADWSKIKPLMDSGKMPNLEALVEEGKHGNLSSTLPIESPVAWSSMTTGTNPGKHGIYGFLERDGDRFVPTSSENVRKKRVWDHIGDKQGEVVVMNVPQTFPPDRVNGKLVASYLSVKEAGYTYPEGLQSDLEEMNYTTEVLEDEFKQGKEDEFLRKLNKTSEKRTEAAKMLMNRTDWEMSFIVYTGLDRLQHYFWKYSGKDGKYSGAIDNHYRKLDGEIGELLENKDENTTVIVVSDHGFGPLEKNVYLNTWLRNEGYLELEGESSRTGLMSRIGITQQKIAGFLSRAGMLQPAKELFSLLGFNPGKSLPEPGLSSIDFSSSEAYAGNYGGKIYLTDSVENRDETLNELERKLKEIEDPESGNTIFEVHRSEDIYTGDMENAPDLVLEPQGPYRAVGFLGHGKVVKRPPKKSGTHRRNGIYVISEGDGKKDADITDVSPTILDILGIEKPEEMDGRSILP